MGVTSKADTGTTWPWRGNSTKSILMAIALLVTLCQIKIEPSMLQASNAVASRIATSTPEKTDPDDASPSKQVKHESTWWVPYVEKSVQSGPLLIHPMPFQVPRHNAKAIVHVLQYLGVTSGSNVDGDATSPNTIIDIGLPQESLSFAQSGYRVHAFEARQRAYNQVKQAIEKRNLQHLITLHHTALSNCSNQTTEIFDASDSSSLLESAVIHGPELTKFNRGGQKKEVVPLEVLDSFVTDAVAMKIDTQGVEPEIFMGAPKLLSENHEKGPFVIITEYCYRMRPLSELLLGPRLLHGLGYTCHFFPNEQPAATLENLKNYCHDFLCVRSPAWNFTQTTTGATG
ncbi:hypothetical protein ACA910_018818 [Epithemia clementina (nom. ined.)]